MPTRYVHARHIYTYSSVIMMKEVKICPTSNHLKVSGYSVEDEALIYNELLDDVFNNPSVYLDNLQYFVTFRVSWKDYRSNTTPIPYELVRKRKHLKSSPTLINQVR